MRIIPAIDVIDGQCVRLTKGDYNTVKSYSSDPVSVAQGFADAGIQHLHIVDLDGAKAGNPQHLALVEQIASKTTLSIQMGGGLRNRQAIDDALSAGVQQVIIGSTAVTQPDAVHAWLSSSIKEHIIIGADYRGLQVATHGWGKQSQQLLLPMLEDYQRAGCGTFICTDIDRDGMLDGPAVEMYDKILKELDLDLIASGGISCIEELATLKDVGCAGAIIGKAIYENKISLQQLSKLC